MPKFVRLIRVRYEHSQPAFYNRVKSTVSPTLVAKRAAQQTFRLFILLMVQLRGLLFSHSIDQSRPRLHAKSAAPKICFVRDIRKDKRASRSWHPEMRRWVVRS
jgi:hypothetical protein